MALDLFCTSIASAFAFVSMIGGIMGGFLGAFASVLVLLSLSALALVMQYVSDRVLSTGPQA